MAADDDVSPEKEFADTTTLHGIGRVSGGSNCVSKTLWLAIFLICFGVATWQITETVLRYLQFNTVTNIHLVFEDNLNFPAVTVCNFNRFDDDIMDPDSRWYLSALLDGQLDDGGGGWHWDAIEEQWVMIDTGGLDPVNATLENGFQMWDGYTLQLCKWKGRTCTSEHFDHIFTTYGNCYTFNAVVDSRDPRRQQLPGAGNGLRLIFDIHAEHYTEDPAKGGSEDVGIKVLVHDQNEPPKMDTQGIAVGPGSHALIGITRVEYLNEEPPWGQCEDVQLDFYDKYTLTGCLLECRAKHVQETCGCRLIHLPGDAPYCEPVDIANCAENALAEVTAGNHTCNCPTPCDVRLFDTTVSYSSWPNKNAARYYVNVTSDIEDFIEGDINDPNDVIDYFRSNWVVMDIYYDNLNYEIVQQQREMTEGALLGNVGGQLGLLIGASVVTIFEFTEYLLLRFTWCCRRKSKANK